MAQATRTFSDKLAAADYVAFDPVYLQGLTLDQITNKIEKECGFRIGRKTLVNILDFYKVQYRCNLTLKTLANSKEKHYQRESMISK